ncbi:SQSTM1.2 family protein [Megaselia abdita]
MSNQTIKITYKSKETQKHFYVMSSSTWAQLVQQIEPNLQEVEINKLRKFWIDNDGDEIEIDNESSFKMFNIQNPLVKKIFLHLPQAETTGTKNHHIHFGVTCDNCESGPIIGFRYKCMECEDFDLCGACEGKMVHGDHVMLRLPGDVKNFETKPFHKRRHGHGGHHGKKHARCPAGFGGILKTIEDLNLQTAMKASERQSSSSSEEASPKKEDPHSKKYEEHMKTSMDMLSNFHKMFSKILDPLGTEIVLEVRRDDMESTDGKEKETSEKDKESTEKAKESTESLKITPEEDKMDEAAGSSTSIQEDSNWEVINKEKSPSPESFSLYPEMRAVLVPEKVTPPPSVYPEMRAVLVTDCGSKMDVDDKADEEKAKSIQEEPRKIYHSSECLFWFHYFTIS